MLTRWDPFREMMSFRDAMDRMMDDSFRVAPFRSGAMGMGMPMDITEAEDNYCVKAELPGVRPDDVNITVHGSTITIQGDVREESETPSRAQSTSQPPTNETKAQQRQPSYHMRERRMGRFMRSVTLPSDASPDRAEANFENGILTLTIPKTEESRPRQIKIKGHERTMPIEGQRSDTESQRPGMNA